MAQQFPPDYFSSGARPRQLKNLRIEEVSSVDVAANPGARVAFHKRGGEDMTAATILRKRREFERATPSYPKWQQPELLKEQTEMRKADHPLQHIKDLTDMVRRNEIGKSVASYRAKAFHDEHLHDAYRKDERGKVLSDHQQFAHAMQHHPVFKALGEAIAQGNESTEDELAKEYGLKNDTDEAHRRQRENLGGGQNDGENPNATKRDMSAIINDQLTAKANELLAQARKEGVKGASFHKIFEYVVTKTAWGRSLYELDRYHRISV
jgi:hypothetical protein